mgnify:CR=1 FL=1
MAGKLEQLKHNLEAALGSRIVSLTQALGEITVVATAADYVAVARTMHDDPRLGFAQLMDLCGVDYSTYGDGDWKGARFAATSQLLSFPSKLHELYKVKDRQIHQNPLEYQLQKAFP